MELDTAMSPSPAVFHIHKKHRGVNQWKHAGWQRTTCSHAAHLPSEGKHEPMIMFVQKCMNFLLEFQKEECFFFLQLNYFRQGHRNRQRLNVKKKNKKKEDKEKKWLAHKCVSTYRLIKKDNQHHICFGIRCISIYAYDPLNSLFVKFVKESFLYLLEKELEEADLSHPYYALLNYVTYLFTFLL